MNSGVQAVGERYSRSVSRLAPGEASSFPCGSPAGSEDPIVVADKLSVTFSHSGVQQHVLKNLDLDVRAGDFTVVMGPSGAGKSTLLHALAGMLRPTLGSVRVHGIDLATLTGRRLAHHRRRTCGFVFQQVHLLDTMSVLDNVLVAGLLGPRPRREVVRRARELLAEVGLDADTQRRFPSMLSGGEAQRAAVVRAVVNDPDILFADEPTGALNWESGARVLDILSTLHNAGQSILMVTHDLRSALRGNRVLYLRDGTIQGELDLGPWTGEDHSRRDTLHAFLGDMGW